MSGKYDDIINMPHHTSKKHPRMSAADRAAQFSPFAALTGYEDAIRETARMTTVKQELDDHVKAELDWKLSLLAEHLSDQPEVSVTCYIGDAEKEGGRYATLIGRLRGIDDHERCLIMADGRRIPVCDIIGIDSVFCDQITETCWFCM